MHQKRRFKVDKLVRDKTSDRLRAQNITVIDRIMDQDEYSQRLKDKLIEEAREVHEAKTTEDIKEELADVLEVVHALGVAYGLSYEQIESTRIKKKQERGGFEARLYGDFLEYDCDNASVNYCLERPHKYPEILPA